MRAAIRVALYTILTVFAVSFALTFALMIVSYGVSHSPVSADTGTDTPLTATSTLVDATSSPSTGATNTPHTQTSTPSSPTVTTPLVNPSLFVYSFNASGVLQEAASATQSTSPYWFLDSGGELFIQNGIGETIQGALAVGDKWQRAYAANNPTDTDGGYHPQNIFRLVTKNTWQNMTSETWFYIAADNFSASPNRNASNGLLLMNRYIDHNNLYYAGVRVDGTAVIKKKYAGTYYTLAQVPVFPGTYDPTSNPTLLPHQTWIGLRTITTTNPNGSVSISLYMSQTMGGGWSLITSAIDDGSYGATPPISGAGSFGIRTDFMDVKFQNIKVSNA